MTSFAQAVGDLQHIGDNRGWAHIAGFHGAPFWYCWHYQHVGESTKSSPRLFLPWHRAYLWWLEQALQDQVDTVALPWWDWTVQRTLPPAYTATKIGADPNPLRRFRISLATTNPPIRHWTRRQPAADPRFRLPSSAEVAALLEDDDFKSFQDQLENLHDQVHVWVGGDVADLTTAAYDPIFYAHHCMIDRIWSLWQAQHGNSGIAEELLDLVLLPFNKRVRDVLDTQSLGYEYAAASTAVPVGNR